RYLAETAQEYGVDRRIRFGHKVVGASWRSEDARWTLDVRAKGGETLRLSCNFLFLCAAFTNMRKAICPAGPAWKDSPAGSFIRRDGPRTSATTASGWSSSAAGRLR